jgi:hypothetical protein
MYGTSRSPNEYDSSKVLGVTENQVSGLRFKLSTSRMQAQSANLLLSKTVLSSYSQEEAEKNREVV